MYLVYIKKMRMSYKSIISGFQSEEGGAVPSIRSNLNDINNHDADDLLVSK